MIEVNNVTVHYDKRTVLQNVDLTAHSGEITTIVGPNGCGKTTLLRAISGELGFKGKISLNGCDISKLRPAQMALYRAVLPQATNLSFPFLVREVVALGCSASGLDRQQSNDLPEQALQRVDLVNYGDRFYQALSGGEQARVQFARILCQIWQPLREQKPCWLFLDEPVASLDIHHQLIIMDIARDFAARGGGVLAVLHDLNLVAHYSDQVLMMKDGEAVHNGSVQDVLTVDNLRQIYQCDLHIKYAADRSARFITPFVTTSHQYSEVG